MRYFHQPKDYWLEHSTYQDWRDIYQRELIEQPPADAFIASYFGYEAPVFGVGAEAEEIEEVTFDASDCEV